MKHRMIMCDANIQFCGKKKKTWKFVHVVYYKQPQMGGDIQHDRSRIHPETLILFK